MNSVDPSSNFVVRRGVGGRVGDDRNENEYYERFQLNQYYNAVEDEQIYMDEYTGLLHRYNEFITNGNAMFSRMEQTLRENLSRTLVRQSFYYNSSGMRARASSDTPAVTAPVAAPVAAAPVAAAPTVADVFPRLLSRYLNNELSREARQPTQPTQPTQPNNNIFSMLYTIPLEVRRTANQGGGGGSAATNEQIHRATMNTTFGNVLSPVNATCPISRDEFNDESEITMIRGCNHIFNRTSLREWFVNHSTCPMCRGDIREYRPPATPTAAPLPEQRRQQQPPQRQNPPANLSIDRIDNNEFTFSYDLPVNYNNDQIYQDIVNTVNQMTNNHRRNDHDDDDDIMEVD